MDKFSERISNAYRVLGGNNQTEIKASTNVIGGGTQRQFFGDSVRNKETLAKYRNIYEQGGIVKQAIDCYPTYALMNGYRLESDHEGSNDADPRVQVVQDFLDRIDFDSLCRQAIIEALIMGDAFHEIVSTRGGGVDNLVPRAAESFEIKYDDKGNITSYVQELLIQGRPVKVELQPEQIFHLTLFQSGGKVYGDSLVKSAFDDIMRDAQTMEGATMAIRRAGYPIYDVAVGVSGEPVPQVMLQDVGRQFQDVNAKNTFIHGADTKIDTLNKTGITGLESYHNVAVKRLCSSLGVPGDLVGFREGTTDRTAEKRIDSFFMKVSSMQKVIARAYNQQIIDRVTGEQGAVRIVFNDVAQQNMMDKIAAVVSMLKVDPIDPWALISREQAYELLGMDITNYGPTDTVNVPEKEPEAPGQDPAFLAQQEKMKDATAQDKEQA